MPKFIFRLKAIEKYEKMPELLTILEENFIQNDLDQWYVPDMTMAGDVAKLREKNYQAIVDLADRLPEATVQEDPNILMYYDISLGHI